MYAIVRKNRYDPAKFDAAGDQLARFDEIHAQQHGFVGTLTIDVGQDSRVVINLWDSQASARAGLEKMRPVANELVTPLLAAESILIGEGELLDDRLIAV
jgi:hypothetical protein